MAMTYPVLVEVRPVAGSARRAGTCRLPHRWCEAPRIVEAGVLAEAHPATDLSGAFCPREWRLRSRTIRVLDRAGPGRTDRTALGGVQCPQWRCAPPIPQRPPAPLGPRGGPPSATRTRVRAWRPAHQRTTAQLWPAWSLLRGSGLNGRAVAWPEPSPFSRLGDRPLRSPSTLGVPGVR